MKSLRQPHGAGLWRQLPLKRIAAINPEVLPENTDPDFEMIYVDIGGVNLEDGIRQTETLRFGDAPSRARRLVKTGDTIVSTVRTYLRAIAPVVDPPDNMVVSTGFAVIRSGGLVDPSFLSWALRSSRFVDAVVAESVGVSYPAIAPTALGRIPIAVPPEADQQAIADFLVREAAKIDALIAKQTEFLLRLDEHRCALTVQAVTRGLDSKTSMQESGVGWIGQVPAHWMLPRIGNYFQVQLGKMLDGSRQTGQHLAPYLRVFDVQWGQINIDNLPAMDFSTEDRVRFTLRPGDLLVNEGGSYVGRSAIWNGDLAECYYQKALHRVRPRTSGDSNRFLYYFMFAAVKLGVFVAGGNQTTIDHLTAEQFRSYRFPRPPLVEQIAIADYLDDVHSRTELAGLRSKEMIERLRERRAALITAAVTGQIDVTEPVLTEAAA